jgi:hypothetical protein
MKIMVFVVLTYSMRATLLVDSIESLGQENNFI